MDFAQQEIWLSIRSKAVTFLPSLKRQYVLLDDDDWNDVVDNPILAILSQFEAVSLGPIQLADMKELLAAIILKMKNEAQKICRTKTRRRMNLRKLASKNGVVAADGTEGKHPTEQFKLRFSHDDGGREDARLAVALNSALGELRPEEVAVFWRRVEPADNTEAEDAEEMGISLARFKAIQKRVQRKMPAALERHGIAAHEYVGARKAYLVKRRRHGQAILPPIPADNVNDLPLEHL